MSADLVAPLPPIAGEELPHVGAGLRFLDAPTAYLQELRARHGDTFLVDLFGFKLLVTFAPKGLENLYKLEEDHASFGLATFDLLGFKTPTEIFADASTELFYKLLLHKRMPGYVQVMNQVVALELARWGAEGDIDIFDAIRTLEQRVGYGLWLAPVAVTEPHWQDLKRSFDVLNQENSFVSPQQTLETIKSGKARERAAVGEIKQLIAQLVALHDADPQRQYAAIDLLREEFSAETPAVRDRKLAHSIINLNQGFLSNLYAAIAWVIVRLLEYPAVMGQVQAEIEHVRGQFGDDFLVSVDALNAMVYLESVMMESIRLAQRSITLRKVLQPVQLDDGAQTYTVQPGVYIATMLSVTNTETEALARFDPAHYRKNQLAAELTPARKETVSTFGHGKHACPAQRFSHHMCKIVVTQLLARYALQPLFEHPEPSAKQMGGVARPDAPARMRYQKRDAERPVP